MMKFIQFDSEKCDSCYKCLRTCPTKAISFNKNSRQIVDELCIKCGLCQQSCPREALSIRSSTMIVRDMIASGEQVIVTIAPSFVGAFGLKEPGRMVALLKKIGFSEVEETAVGADLVVDEYKRFLIETENDVVITSCCPSAYYLIEQHYPHIIPNLIPVVSPMVAHGRSIKERFGQEVKTVFIGPCLAKMAEAEESENAIDAVLTFAELEEMMKEDSLKLHEFEPEAFHIKTSSVGRAFPLGIDFEDHEKNYQYLHVDGIESCKEVLKEIRNGSLKNCCIEINICEGSCLGGPDMPKNSLGTYSRQLFVKDYIDSKKNDMEKIPAIETKVNLKKEFTDKQMFKSEPNISMVYNILKQMGKYTKEDELNCGACGYKTCYDKAKAVFYGYSDIETCLPYLQEKAESMQSIMIEHSPNAVVLLDNELVVQEVNPTFNKIFNKDNLPVEDMPIKLFVDHPIFEEIIKNKENITNQKIYIKEYNTYYFANLVYIEDDQMIIGFLTDISSDIHRQKEFERVKEETLLKTQEVIDKQMRVAQEIASLLGETTAETKMSLKSLNNLVLQERGGL